MADVEAGFPDMNYDELSPGALIQGLVEPILHHQGLDRTAGTGQGVVAALNWLLSERTTALAGSEQQAYAAVVARAVDVLMPREVQ